MPQINFIRGNPNQKGNFLESLLYGIGEQAPDVIEKYFNENKRKKENAALGIHEDIRDPDVRKDLALKAYEAKEAKSIFDQLGLTGNKNSQQPQQEDPINQLMQREQATQEYPMSRFPDEKGNQTDFSAGMPSPNPPKNKSSYPSPVEKKGGGSVFSDLSNEELAPWTKHPNKMISGAAEAEEQRRIRENKLGQENREFKYKTYKDTEKYRNDIIESNKAAKNTIAKLDRILELNPKADIGPMKSKLAGYLGVPISSLANADAEELEKLSFDLTKDISQFYKGRILQSEFLTFLKTIPSLMNSVEGRERISNNLKLFAEMEKLPYEAYQEIRKEIGDAPLPADLEEQVNDKVTQRADKLLEDFNRGIPKEKSKADRVIMRAPDGRRYYVNKDEVDKYKKAGGVTE